MEQKIFISYCRKDFAKAKRIKEEIERTTSAKCWMDLDGIESGSQFEDVIISAINNASIVVFMLSNNSMLSRWTKDEVRYAYETRKKIIPVNIDNCSPSGWFLFKFSGYDVIDINDPLQKHKFFENIKDWIGRDGLIEKAPADAKNSTEINNIYCNVFWGCQYIVFGLILFVMSSMFFVGLLTMKEGTIAMRYNILLCTCLCLTIYSTYLLSVKKKKNALFLICVLDVIEIILLCVVAKRVAGYALLSGYHYKSFPYVQINGLGWEIVNKGELIVISLMELFAIIHILLLLGGLFIKIKGHSLWDRLV